jgi:hypothetical protein
MGMNYLVMAAAVLGLTITGCGVGSTVAGAPVPTPALSETRAVAQHVGKPGSWPDARPPAAASCISVYPDELSTNANAFDGTVTGVHVGELDKDAAAAPATVEVVVHETFAGHRRGTVTMKTWDFMLPEDPTSVVGLRVLLAAGDTLDLKGCGYSRPYNASEAKTWREAF